MFFFCLLLASLFSPVAKAQEAGNDQIDFSNFRPPPDGMRYFGVPSASTFRHWQLGVSIWASYANDPLLLTMGDRRVAPDAIEVDGEIGDAIVDHRFIGNIQLSLGFMNHFSLSMDMPLVFWQSGYQLSGIDDPQLGISELVPSGLGDIRIYPKVVILDRDKQPIGLAIAAPVGLPTGNGGSFLGEGGLSTTPQAVIEFSDGSIRERGYIIRGAFYGGYHIRPADQILYNDVGNEGVYGTAIAFHPVSFVEFLAEYRGKVSANGQAGEFLAGIKFLAGKSVEVNLGGGAGTVPGLGTPDYRGIFGVTVAPVFDPKYHDPDGDGLQGKFDKCPQRAEDFDKFQDDDGCPDPDNDQDGLLDKKDGCPDQAEDKDGYKDEDGCPDPDNDKDGILDVDDSCPNKKEIFNKHKDEDGCPDFKPIGDADGDGIKDGYDKCTFKPEDIDGFQDEDGCPDPDNDKDGVPDFKDQCANAREVYNGVDDHDGCPDESDRVKIVAKKIQIMEKIFFDFNKSKIKKKSFDLIDEIASLILAYPDIKKIKIEGHTDHVGSDKYNQKLSQKRADAVRAALIKRGVKSARLIPVGLGKTQPLMKGKSKKAGEKNRRVEFIILERK